MGKTFEGLLAEIIKITQGNLNFINGLKPDIERIDPLYIQEIQDIQNYINELDWLMEYNENYAHKALQNSIKYDEDAING